MIRKTKREQSVEMPVDDYEREIGLWFDIIERAVRAVMGPPYNVASERIHELINDTAAEKGH